MNFMIAQCLGIITTVVALLSVQFKKVESILIGQIISNVLVALSFGLLGGLSGAWICILAAIQTLIIYFLDRSETPKKEQKKAVLLVLFVIGYIVGTVIVYKGWGDIIAGICAILFVLAIAQTESGKLRVIMMLNALLWIIYDYKTRAYTNILTHGLELLSILAAMIRLDRKAADRGKDHLEGKSADKGKSPSSE